MRLISTEDLGSLIREGRKRAGLDQKQLAEQIGVSRKWVNDIETGKARAALHLVLRALRVLRISLNASYESDLPKPDHTLIDLDNLIDISVREKRSDK